MLYLEDYVESKNVEFVLYFLPSIYKRDFYKKFDSHIWCEDMQYFSSEKNSFKRGFAESSATELSSYTC